MFVQSSRRVIVAALILVSLGCSHLCGQKPSVGRALNERNRDQVFDLLFPRGVLDTVGTFSFVLRYEPSFGIESQITIVQREGKFEVLEYSSQNGSIEQQLNQKLKHSPRATPRMLAKGITIRRRDIKITSEEGNRWRDDFYASACPTFRDDKLFYNGKEITLVMDGTRYQLWYSGMGRIHYDLWGTDVDSKESDQEPIISWMKTLYRRVRELRPEK